MIEKPELMAEMHAATVRMTADSSRPSAMQLRNRLLDSIIRRPSLISPEIPGGSNGIILAHIDAMGVLRIPELTILYQRQTKQTAVPGNPSSFFEPLDKVNTFNLKESGLTQDDVIYGRETFERVTDALEGEIPVMWSLAEVTGIVLAAQRIKRFDDYQSWIKEFKKQLPDLPDPIKKTLIFGYMVLGVMEQSAPAD